MKYCNKCDQWKDESEFHKNKSKKDGLQPTCKHCKKEYQQANKEKIRKQQKKYYQKNKEKKKEYRKKYRKNNKEKIKKHKKEYYQNHKEEIKKYQSNNKEKIKEYHKKWSKEHKAEYNAYSAKRHAKKVSATPSYVNNKLIKRKYRIASILSKMTGTKYHVDHIIPLQSDLVCGLHHEDNLQIISAEQNLRKNNKFKPFIENFQQGLRYE